MDYTIMLVLFTGFMVKHFIADFPLQTPFMYMNKGTLGHPGGIYHAGTHVILSGLLLFSVEDAVLGILLFEFLVHYFCDLYKVKLTKKFGWADMGKNAEGKDCLRIYHNHYFIALGVDQLVHMLTYVAMIWMYIQI